MSAATNQTLTGMLDPNTKPFQKWPQGEERPTYEQLKLAGEDRTPENYVDRYIAFFKQKPAFQKLWSAKDAVETYAEARMGAFEADHVKSQADAKPADSYSPVKGYKTSDI